MIGMILVRLLAAVIVKDANRRNTGIIVVWVFNASQQLRIQDNFVNTLPLEIIVSVVLSLLQATAALLLPIARVTVDIR
jgi:hypothetical protein